MLRLVRKRRVLNGTPERGRGSLAPKSKNQKSSAAQWEVSVFRRVSPTRCRDSGLPFHFLALSFGINGDTGINGDRPLFLHTSPTLPRSVPAFLPKINMPNGLFFNDAANNRGHGFSSSLHYPIQPQFQYRRIAGQQR